ncbi:hypothetical protein [Kribbella sp. NPDC048915]|uniref:TrmB family transcriptional regulator n=1 Tax=Kribbella sp. NPDC048915 TaxID=3155148 RepID=UPI0033EFBF75
MFEVLGLGEPAETVYRTLIDMGSADDTELAGTLGMTRGDAAAALADLERLGLAARSGTNPGRHVASPPTVALAALLAQRHDDLKRAEIAMAALAEAYRRAEVEHRAGEVVDVVYGDQAVTQRFLQLQAAARTEVLSLTKSDVLAVPGEENTTEPAAARRGVRFNVVLERASLARPGVVAGATTALAAGEQVRVVPEVPFGCWSWTARWRSSRCSVRHPARSMRCWSTKAAYWTG